jgi:hypothetical protein
MEGNERTEVSDRVSIPIAHKRHLLTFFTDAKSSKSSNASANAVSGCKPSSVSKQKKRKSA